MCFCSAAVEHFPSKYQYVGDSWDGFQASVPANGVLHLLACRRVFDPIRDRLSFITYQGSKDQIGVYVHTWY